MQASATAQLAALRFKPLAGIIGLLTRMGRNTQKDLLKGFKPLAGIIGLLTPQFWVSFTMPSRRFKPLAGIIGLLTWACASCARR